MVVVEPRDSDAVARAVSAVGSAQGRTYMESYSSSIRVFLAEDNDADAMIVGEVLRTHPADYELVRVKDGEAALDFVATLEDSPTLPTPHIFVLDLHLPKHDGLEIIKVIRASLRCRALPIIALSASDSPQELERVESHSAIYFRKPSDFESYMKLAAVVQNVIRDQPCEESTHER